MAREGQEWLGMARDASCTLFEFERKLHTKGSNPMQLYATLKIFTSVPIPHPDITSLPISSTTSQTNPHGLCSRVLKSV